MEGGNAPEGFGQVLRRRIVDEMLGECRESDSDWRVLVMDEVTVQVVSSVLAMSEILDVGVSLVEDIHKVREPFPKMSGIYFISPTVSSVKQLVADFKRRKQYKKAFVYFSSAVPEGVLTTIKSSPELVKCLGALKQMNLEVLLSDLQGFITGQPRALLDLYCEGAENSPAYDDTIDVMASRLVTAFESLKEMPSIRYCAPRDSSSSTSQPLGTVSKELAERVSELLSSSTLGMQAESCDLIILERGVDAVSPCIHDFYYEAMAYDLLEVESTNSSYKYAVDTQGGNTEERTVILNDKDPLWAEMRFMHIGEALMRLDEKTKKFGSKNKAANLSKSGGRLTTRDLKNMVQALPQFREQLSKIALHVEMASKINDHIHKRKLDKLGELEQDVVLGDSHGKDLIKLFQEDASSDEQDRLRLLLCYFSTHPGKLDTVQKQLQWQKLARLDAEDMNAINNLPFIGVQLKSDESSKESKLGLKFKKGSRRSNQMMRRRISRSETSEDGGEEWGLSRFQPLIMDILEDLSNGHLSTEEYPYIREPDDVSARPAVIKSVRSSRSTTSAVGESAAVLSNKMKSMNLGKRRLVVFIVGGAMRSELRVVHRLTSQLGREVVIGSTHMETSKEYIAALKQMSAMDDVGL